MSKAANAAPLPVVILVSGRGSNLRALIDARDRGLPIDIRAVICDRPGAAALELARERGIQTWLVTKDEYPRRSDYDQALTQLLERLQPRVVVLAGFMRLLSADFVNHYAGRLINIHPSLLPAFPGLNTHQRALAAGVPEHGATVHYVTSEVDAGPIIAQVRVPVAPDDTADTLAQRVLEQEHRLYPATLRLLWQNRIQWRDGTIFLDGRALRQPLRLSTQGDADFS